ncbi:14-3-3 protein [Venturia nashicola]|uniref:14-3-3 protein n=1 Tax=Venturia nashicola TaxID=86259 RepID=A0A4Z1P9J0_9PEZI|nr:14-3-3 protein [Venturia nashicola]TLD34488.1 14-3-3 protein [Venturia nashicola]
MASSDVDQKYLGRIASHIEEANPLVSKSLYQILGLSVILARKLFRARKLRKLDTSRDTKSLQLYHHIIWLSREGLSILEICVLPYTQNGELGPECQVIAVKLRASLYHIFCLFHNNPPVSTAIAGKGSASATPAPLSPRLDTLNRRTQSGSGGSQRDSTPPKRNSKGKKPLLRDPIDSITSDASFLTNPYAGMQPGTISPGITPQLPPGLAPIPPKPSAFLLPAIDFIPLTSAHFRAATITATACLPGAHPLRLSVAIEHAAFLWDCVHDHEGARTISRRAIRALQEGEEDENLTDEAYDDAVEMVGQLGRTMRKKSWEGTPQSGADSTPSIGNPSPAPPKKVSPPLPPIPAPPPTVPIPTTPRKVAVRKDQDYSPGLVGGPVGRTPKISPKSPASERRASKGSSYRSHRPSGSGGRGTRDQVSPRKDPTPARRSNEITPPSDPRKDTQGYQTVPSQTPPSSQRRRPAGMPPIPPPKDYTSTTLSGPTPPRTAKASASLNRPSDEITPTQRVTSQHSTPKSQPARERRPSTSRGSGQKVAYPLPMDDSPPRASDLDLSGGPVQAVEPIYQSSVLPVTQIGAQIRQNGHYQNGNQNGNGNGAPYDYIANYGDGAQGGFYPSDEDRDRRRLMNR